MTLVLFQNSFVTLEEAEAYFDERFDSDKWTNPDSKPEDGVKEKLLITASRKINRFVLWASLLKTTSQWLFQEILSFRRTSKMRCAKRPTLC